jgi:hypothetical protein
MVVQHPQGCLMASMATLAGSFWMMMTKDSATPWQHCTFHSM